MIKKNKLSLLALSIASILLFTACSQDAYSGFFNFMSVNVYSDTLGLTLPGESADAAIAAVADATVPTSKSVEIEFNTTETSSFESSGEVTKTLDLSVIEDDLAIIPTTPLTAVVKKGSAIDSAYVSEILSATDKKVVVIYENGVTTIPKLAIKTQAEKEALTASLTTSNAQAKESLKNSLAVIETDKTTLLAAYNTSLIVKSSLDAIKVELVVGPDETSTQLRSLMDKLIPELPATPSKADILQVQLAYNVVNSLNDAFVAMKVNSIVTLNTVDFQTAAQDSGVIAKLVSVLNDANAAITVANLNNQNGELIDTLDIGSLIDGLQAKSSSKGLALSDSDKAEINSRIKDLSPTIKMFLKSYVGIKKDGDKYVYDPALRTANVRSNYIISGMFSSYFSVASMANPNNTVLKTRLSSYDRFVGLDGLESYFISFFLNNIDSGLKNLISYYNANRNIGDPEYNTVKPFMDAYLLNHTAAFDAIFNNTEVDVMSFYYIDSDSDADPILKSIGGESNLESSDIIINMLTKVDFGQFIANCEIILTNTPGYLDNSILKDISSALYSVKIKIDSIFKVI